MFFISHSARLPVLRLAAVVVLAIALLLAVLPTVPHAGAQDFEPPIDVIEPMTSFTFVPPSNEVIEMTPANGSITATVNAEGDILFTFVTFDETLRIDVQLINGDPAAPVVSGVNYGGLITSRLNGEILCEAQPSDFEVLEVVYDEFFLELFELAVDFNDYCGGFRGSIRIDSMIPVDRETSISGTVTAEATGLPLADIRVCAFDGITESYCGTTGSDGTYAISGFPEAIYGVEFFDPNGRGYAGECFPADYICDSAFGLPKANVINVSTGIDAALKPGCAFELATIVGDDSDNILTGTPGQDVIVAGAGNDVITGMGGNDIVCAGPGADAVALGDGHDYVHGGPGADTIDAGDGDNGIWSAGGNDRVTVGSGNDVIYAGGGNDVVFAGSGANIVFGQGGADLLYGGANEDEMYGGPGYDTLRGYGSVDFLNAGGGNDTIYGGGGDDNLYGKPGDDTIYGEAGNDEIYGAGGADTMLGGDGNDRIQGAAGNDRLEGGNGDDTLYGQAQSDTMLGDAGNDTLYASSGNDNLDGGAGNDNLQAGGGNDTLTGGAGNDLLYGQAGVNTLNGGPDTDQCFAGGTGSTVAGCE